MSIEIVVPLEWERCGTGYGPVSMGVGKPPTLRFAKHGAPEKRKVKIRTLKTEGCGTRLKGG
jgi:hypothetical protein